MDRPALAIFFEEGADAGGAEEQASERRSEHRAEHRRAVFDQRHVHGELAVAVHELARAVERVDQPEKAACRGLETAGDRLLGDDREFRPQLPERTGDERLGARVGCGQRRAVRLFPGAEVGAVNLHHCCTGGTDDRDEGFEQPGGGGDVHRAGREARGRSGQSNRSVARAPRDAIPPCHGGRAVERAGRRPPLC